MLRISLSFAIRTRVEVLKNKLGLPIEAHAGDPSSRTFHMEDKCFRRTDSYRRSGREEEMSRTVMYAATFSSFKLSNNRRRKGVGFIILFSPKAECRKLHIIRRLFALKTIRDSE